MDAAIRIAVRKRARDRCEYCGLPQSALPETTFHVEHIVAKQHGGPDDLGNLAMACDRCNLYKGPNLTGVDPATGNIVLLFNPRRDAWVVHFAQDGTEIVGLTESGRATVKLLMMNAPRRLELRAALKLDPPPT